MKNFFLKKILEIQGEVMDLAEEACDVLPSEYSDQCKGNFFSK